MPNTGIIRDIDKGKGEIIRVEISEFKGKQLVNIRTWYTDANGEYKPTQKGIAIAPEIFPELQQAILEAGSRLASSS